MAATSSSAPAARPKTIRGQLTRMVLIPGVSFLVLWTLMTAAGAVQAVETARAVQQGRAGTAALDALGDDLREERRLGQIRIGDPGDARAAERFAEQRAATDASLRGAAGAAAALSGDPDRETRRAAADLAAGDGGAARTLDRLRTEADSGAGDRTDVLDGYSEVLTDVQVLRSALLRAAADAAEAGPARDLEDAREEYSRAEALLAGAIAAGAMDYQDTSHFTYLTASYRDTLQRLAPDLRGEVRTGYEEMTSGRDWARTERLSRGVVTRPPVAEPEFPGDPAEWNDEIGVGAEEWEQAAGAAGAAFDALTEAQLEQAYTAAWSSALRLIGLSAGGALLTLAAGTAAIVVAVRSARRLTGRLRRLRAETLALSDTRLPELVERAQSGRKVDVGAELPRLDHGEDEIGEVADAFDTAQRTAVGAAVKQAEIREGANRAFLGIAYRNQAIVQRQLRLLDEIEYAEDDPETLKKLSRLDHLATRARRYADNLIILGGAQGARRWREPMPMVDVLRAAISETEDYERVRLTSAPEALLRGAAVADVVHLLAELVENAAQFSPAGTPVDVHCGAVSGGLSVDVEDRGLGMTAEGHAEAERTLAEAPEFDVMALLDEPRLGLFVVARLAARHGIAVRLSPSPYGGTRATALIPADLLEAPTDGRAARPAAVTAGGPAAEGGGRG